MRIHRPWRDKRGRLVPIKALALLLLCLPALNLGFDAWRGHLGPRAWNAAVHEAGFWAECFVLATLALSPLRLIWDWPRLVFIRRIAGIGALSYIGLHLVLYAGDLKFAWAQIFWETFTRFYLIIGVISVAGLLALGVTSTDAMTRRMGPRWKQLHRLIFPIAVLTTLHYSLQNKVGIDSPALAFGVLAWLFAWRLLPARWGRNVIALLALAVFAAVMTATVEATWYGLATGVNWRRVLAANLDQQFDALRPSGQAGLLGLGVALAALLRPWLSRALSRLPPRLARAPSR